MRLEELYINPSEQREYIMFIANHLAEYGNSPNVQQTLSDTHYFNWDRQKRSVRDGLKDIDLQNSRAVAKQVTILANSGDEMLPKRLANRLRGH